MKQKQTYISIVLLTASILLAYSQLSAWASNRNQPKSATKSQQKEQLYIGCWSSENGSVLAITSTTIQTGSSYKPLAYKEVDNNAAQRTYLLKLSENDESYLLQVYQSLEVNNDAKEMQHSIYGSYNDFLKGHYSRRITWLRDDCDTVYPYMKGKPR